RLCPRSCPRRYRDAAPPRTAISLSVSERSDERLRMFESGKTFTAWSGTPRTPAPLGEEGRAVERRCVVVVVDEEGGRFLRMRERGRLAVVTASKQWNERSQNRARTLGSRDVKVAFRQLGDHG